MPSSNNGENYPKSTSGTLFSANQLGALKFDLLSSDLIKKIFSFLDEDGQHRLAMINSSNKNTLMQTFLVNHFLTIVAEGRPPEYEVSFSQEHTLKPGIFAINLPEEKEINEIRYAVLTPQGDIAYGTITQNDLSKFNVTFPMPLTLETIKTILPDILEITAVRGHTYATDAEKLLATHSELKKLVGQKGNVTDFAGFHFTNITAFQYARWAKDKHMWSMLQKYMTHQEVENQLAEMKENKFKSQNGSYWDCPKKYDLSYFVLDEIPTLGELKINIEYLPSVIKIGKEESKYYIYGYSDDGRTPQLKELDKAMITGDVIELEEALKNLDKNSIHVTNTNKYSALHTEIESKEGHFVNPLTVALQDFVIALREYDALPAYKKMMANVNDHLDKLLFTVGAAQRMVPVHIVNEYCRRDRSFSPTPDFKEPVLPRTCKLWYKTAWYPLRDNVDGCLLYSCRVDELKDLNVSKIKIPLLIAESNDNGETDYHLLALRPNTQAPAFSSAFKIDQFEKIKFSNNVNEYNSVWLFPQDKDYMTLAEQGLTFSSLGLNFGIIRVGGWGATSAEGSNWDWGGREAADLLAVSALCHERTLEVKQLIQPAVAAEHGLTND